MKNKIFTPELVAPCGANCGTCVAFFGYTMKGEKRKHTCPGCRHRSNLCAFIKKQCPKLAAKQIEYCFECADFPCRDLETLDRRDSKFGMSMIENLKYIKENGIEQFLINEEKRWKCSDCGGVVCIHNRMCYTCRTRKL